MNSTTAAKDRALISWVIAIAVLALGLRLAYQAGMVAFDGSFHNGSDSGKYLRIAQALWLTGTAPQTERLPLYNYFIAAVFKVVGAANLRAVVTVQAVFDAFSVMGIALAARAFARELVIPAAVVAAIIPNFVVHSSSILTENVFLLLITFGLAALLWAVKSERTLILLAAAGIMFGLTLLTRLTLTYLPFFLVPALIFALRTERHLPWSQCIALSLVVPVVMALMASPLLISNYMHYGYLAMSSQPGGHLLFWVYGCLATPWPCADRGGVAATVAPIAAEYVRALGVESANPFAASVVMKNLAVQRILELPFWQIAFGIAWGAFRNLMQTGFYEVFTQFHQAPTFLSAMHAPSFLGRIREFVLVNWSNPFMALWVVSQVTLVVCRAIQILGAATGLSNARFRALTMLLLVLIVYILALNGPIADPKYRIPVEPALIILFALGLTYNPLMLSLRGWLVTRACRAFGRTPQSAVSSR